MAESDNGNEMEGSRSQVKENVSVAKTGNKGGKKSKPKKEGKYNEIFVTRMIFL